MLLLLSVTSVSAASTWLDGAQFRNNSNSPVWVTIYESSLPLGPWTIVKADCVSMKKSGSWRYLPSTAYMKIRAQAIKGHGDCNDGTYWDGSVSRSANSNGGAMSATFNSQSDGGSNLNSP
jgi:hypothetical protein